MANTASTLEGKHLLVSDSNETSKQFDSKKLEYGVLVELAQDNLFKTRFPHLYSRYLNKWQYDACKDMLEQNMDLKREQLDGLKNVRPSGKFKVVDGQVILVKVVEFKKMVADTNVAISPEQYVREQWDIPSDFTLEQWTGGCMLRGSSKVDGGTVHRPSNSTILLTSENIPSHAHNSGLAGSEGSIRTVKVEEASANPGSRQNASASMGSIPYPMFNNGKSTTGDQKQMKQGVFSRFRTQECGIDTIEHNNIPEAQDYYVFVVSKIE